jgi:hypothetical protein
VQKMPDRPPLQIILLLLSVALFLPSALQAQSGRLYKVELLVFSHPTGATSEAWDPTPKLNYPKRWRFLNGQKVPPTAEPPVNSSPNVNAESSAKKGSAFFVSQSSSAREFRGAAASMNRSGRYRVLFHDSWIQPINSQSRAVPIVLDRSGDNGTWPELQGSVKLYVSRYLYLETNLWLNTTGEYLDSSWQMTAPPLGPVSVTVKKPLLRQQTPVVTEQRNALQTGPSMPQGSTTVLLEEAGPAYPYRHAVLLDQTRRMRSGEVHYIDHPMLGVIVKVTPLAVTEPAIVSKAGANPEESGSRSTAQ